MVFRIFRKLAVKVLSNSKNLQIQSILPGILSFPYSSAHPSPYITKISNWRVRQRLKHSALQLGPLLTLFASKSLFVFLQFFPGLVSRVFIVIRGKLSIALLNVYNNCVHIIVMHGPIVREYLATLVYCIIYWAYIIFASINRNFRPRLGMYLNMLTVVVINERAIKYNDLKATYWTAVGPYLLYIVTE